MSAVPTEFPAGRRFRDRFGDNALYAVTALTGVGVVALLVAIAWKVFDGSSLAFSEFGLGFIVDDVWNPVTQQFGALNFISARRSRRSWPSCSPRRWRSGSRSS